MPLGTCLNNSSSAFTEAITVPDSRSLFKFPLIYKCNSSPLNHECLRGEPTIDGCSNTLQNTLNDLYFNTYDTWISPDQFDALNITPDQFDALNITPDQFDRRAREILGGN